MRKRKIITDLRQFIDILRAEDELLVIEDEVDPYLEIAEIHRRVISRGGPALFFNNVRGSVFPVATNLFGSGKRMDLAFGARPRRFVTELVRNLENLDFSPARLWQMRGVARSAMKLGLRKVKKAPILDNCQIPPRLGELPLLTSWETDGGAFVTLPLVYTEHPETGGHNLGMYRVQRYDDETTGIHWQIHKGGGFHYHVAEARNESLPMSLFIGGPPALIMAAIAPLPENIPELILASLLQGEKLEMAPDLHGGHPLVARVEFAVKGEVAPHMRRPEGPFGDHFGYNSLRHDYPVFKAHRLYHRNNAIYPATVVGRPRQEDYYIGDFLQELLSPLFPLVMKGVSQLKTFGDTGFHSLAAARVENRYPREAFAAGMRILGEGQLSLTKFLILTDGSIDVADFPVLWRHVLERADFTRDLFVFSHVSQDTLDYTGPAVNKGSKGILLGLGREARRELRDEFNGSLPSECSRVKAFLPGTLVVNGPAWEDGDGFPARLAAHAGLGDWPVVFLVDDVAAATAGLPEFMWTMFTRFEPAADIYGAGSECRRFHLSLEAPIVFDCRMKSWYPHALEVDAATRRKVDERIGRLVPQIG